MIDVHKFEVEVPSKKGTTEVKCGLRSNKGLILEWPMHDRLVEIHDGIWTATGPMGFYSIFISRNEKGEPVKVRKVRLDCEYDDD